MISTREEYEKVFLAAAKDLDIDVKADTLWLNPRGGLRLSRNGRNFLRDTLELEPTRFEFQSKKFENKLLLDLERYFTTPYYLHPARPPEPQIGAYKAASIFSGKIALSIGLIGSVEDYIKNLKKTA